MKVISCKCDFQFIQTLECRGDADKGEFVTNHRQIWFQKFAQIWFKIYTNRGDTVAGGLFRRRGAAGMQRVPQFAEFANFWNEWKSLIQICCLNYILFASITITLHKFWDISSEMHFVFFIGIICCCLLNSDCSFQMWMFNSGGGGHDDHTYFNFVIIVGSLLQTYLKYHVAVWGLFE